MLIHPQIGLITGRGDGLLGQGNGHYPGTQIGQCLLGQTIFLCLGYGAAVKLGGQLLLETGAGRQAAHAADGRLLIGGAVAHIRFHHQHISLLPGLLNGGGQRVELLLAHMDGAHDPEVFIPLAGVPEAGFGMGQQR